jgi:hypothetical protein
LTKSACTCKADHPKGKPGIAESPAWLVGIERRQFPQRRLPPHHPDQQAKREIPDIGKRALAGYRGEGIDRSSDAAGEQQPEHRGRPAGPEQEMGNIDKRIVHPRILAAGVPGAGRRH